MKSNVSKKIGFTRTVILTVAAIATTSLTAVAANAANPELNRSSLIVRVPASQSASAKSSPVNKTAGQEKGGTITSKFAEACTTDHSALDASVLAPYKRLMESKDTQAAYV